MPARKEKIDIITRLQKHTAKSIHECLQSISPIVSQALVEKPESLGPIDASEQKTPAGSRPLLETANRYAFLYNLDQFKLSPAVEQLRQLVSAYPDAHFLILLCTYSELGTFESSTTTENLENRVVASFNAANIFFGASRDAFFQAGALRGRKLFFNCIEHSGAFVQGKKGIASILDKCQFSGTVAESSLEGYLKEVGQLISEEPSFPLRARAFLERFWLVVLNFCASVPAGGDGSGKSPQWNSLADLTLVAALQDAHRFLFPVCVDATAFADLFVRNFAAGTGLEYADCRFTHEKLDFSPFRHLTAPAPSIATARSAMALAGLFTLITAHGLKYDRFFHGMARLINPWLLALECFEPVCAKMERILVQPTIPDKHLHDCFARISTLAARYAPSHDVLRLVGLMSKLLAAHPSLRSQLPEIKSFDYEQPEGTANAGQSCLSVNAGLHVELGLLARHPNPRVQAITREMLCGVSHSFHVQSSLRGKQAAFVPFTEKNDELAALWSA